MQQPQGKIELVFADHSHKRTNLVVLLTIYGYLLGLNVCTQPEKNPCVYLETCSSDGEGAACDCPQGMRGDGRKKGKGCQKHFPLDTALGKLTQDT